MASQLNSKSWVVLKGSAVPGNNASHFLPDVDVNYHGQV